MTSTPQPAITDASVLMYIHQIGLAQVLEQLYGEVIAPQAVWDEVERGRHDARDVPSAAAIPWLKVRAAPPTPPELKGRSLDPGEIEVLAMAIAARGSGEPVLAFVLLDDRDARQVAVELDIAHTGVFGILLAAKDKGLIPAVAPYLEHLKRLGFRATLALYEEVLRRAGESAGEG